METNGKVLEFARGYASPFSKKGEQVRALAEKQTRVVVEAEEFAGYRWNKAKFGHVGGEKAARKAAGGRK